MATALFQCTSMSVAQNFERCLPVAPVEVIDFQWFDNFACIIFNGDCYNMYWWCMDISAQSPRTVSFIGVDEFAMHADDPYKLVLLASTPLTSSLRTDAQEYYYNELVEKFMSAILHFEFDDHQLRRICTQCVLGSGDLKSADRCFTRVKICMCQGRQCDYRKLLSIDESVYSSDWLNTLVRVMAHICYLDTTMRSNDDGAFEGHVNKFLNFIFGRR